MCVSLPEGDTHTDQRVSFYTLNQAMLHRIIYSAGSDAHINIQSLYELVNIKHNYWNSPLSINFEAFDIYKVTCEYHLQNHFNIDSIKFTCHQDW